MKTPQEIGTEHTGGEPGHELPNGGPIQGEGNALDTILDKAKDKVNTVTEAASPAEQERLLREMESLFVRARRVLPDKYEIYIDCMPSWEDVKSGLTPDVIASALKLKKPKRKLLLVPPADPASLIFMFDNHKSGRHINDTFSPQYRFATEESLKQLWLGGKDLPRKWRASIVEGVEEVDPIAGITRRDDWNRELIAEHVDNIRKEGLDVVNDLAEYTVLEMMAIEDGTHLDEKGKTILNGANIRGGGSVAYADWLIDGRMRYFTSHLEPMMGLRRKVSIPLPDAKEQEAFIIAEGDEKLYMRAQKPKETKPGPEENPEERLMLQLESQYERQVNDLRETGLDNDRMPAWSDISRALTPEIVRKALEMENVLKGVPKGVLSAKCDKRLKVKAYDSHAVPGQKLNTEGIYVNDEDMGKIEKDKSYKWKYAIIDGRKKPQRPPEIKISECLVCPLCHAFVNHLRKMGFDVLEDEGQYLSFLRQSLVEGNPIDSDSMTFLGASKAAKSDNVRRAGWFGDHIFFGSKHGMTYVDDTFVRAMIKVKL